MIELSPDYVGFIFKSIVISNVVHPLRRPQSSGIQWNSKQKLGKKTTGNKFNEKEFQWLRAIICSKDTYYMELRMEVDTPLILDKKF